jgi:hypothetical protein
MRKRAVVATLWLLLVGCESITHEDERQKLKTNLDAKTAECQKLQEELTEINSKLADGSKELAFDEAIVGLAAQIKSVGFDFSNGSVRYAVWVGNITLSGRKRVPNDEAPYWDASPATPISDANDRLGPYIEDALKIRLAEGNRVTIKSSSDLVILGSYEPDTRDTIKLQLWMQGRGQDGFSNSFVRRISRNSINPYYLHFLNQVE